MRIAALGKKGRITERMKALGGLDPEARKAAGLALNAVKDAVAEALESRRAGLADAALDARLARERVDVSLPPRAEPRGRIHPITQTIDELTAIFCEMGFTVAEGPHIETDFNNFTALNMPPNHPARSNFDTLFVKYGEPGSTLLRTHTSPVQIRVMQEWDLPIYAVMPGRVFRRDTPDATHMRVFHQIEGLVVDKGITFAHLAGTIEAFTKAFFGSDFTSRLRPSYFPFTEQSAEFDVRSANGKWVELGGCGMVHPNVLQAGGIDPEVYTGFAFGFGIDRMAKERHEVADLRDMYANDLRFVRQF